MKKEKSFTGIKIIAIFLTAVFIFCIGTPYFIRWIFSKEYLTEKTAQEWLEKRYDSSFTLKGSRTFGMHSGYRDTYIEYFFENENKVQCSVVTSKNQYDQLLPPNWDNYVVRYVEEQFGKLYLEFNTDQYIFYYRYYDFLIDYKTPIRDWNDDMINQLAKDIVVVFDHFPPGETASYYGFSNDMCPYVLEKAGCTTTEEKEEYIRQQLKEEAIRDAELFGDI